ncbi:GH25 family lysozyme [Lentilactobacillus senioris]|uniref:GH25 family lysozyme n=1 Tax=Lentilactobacillus senioris TaxID=931534 RepID=UPI00227EFE7D|nr:GH25 family lysozyme [Lentilactobacillus senioris]MCY9807423.1 GH25 family lysozyme [Lentilactobacillus senioris]
MTTKLGKALLGLGLVGGMLMAGGVTASADTTLSEKPAGTMGSSYPVQQYNAFAKSRISINRSNSVPDLSEWQGSFTDAQVKKLKNQVPFVILRVQYGSDYKDKTFNHNVALMQKYGVPYGVYSFSQYSSASDAKTEARDLYNRAPDAEFYVNDYEDQTTSGNTNTAATNWYNTIKPLAGSRKVLLYSYASFMQSYASSAVKDYDGFWLAAYQTSEPTSASHVLWQYTDSYYMSSLGQAVDASVSTSKDSSWFLSGASTGSDNSSDNNGDTDNSSNTDTDNNTDTNGVDPDDSTGANNSNSTSNVASNFNYIDIDSQFTVKNKPGHNFFNHIPNEGRYSYKKLHNGSTYAGKNITVDSQGTKKSGSSHSYYRAYYKGKKIGWIYDTALASKITYTTPSLKVKVKANPASNFYNHVTNSKYTVKKTHNGSTYAGKTLTVNAAGVKYGWKTPYYRAYYNGKLVGWIYSGSVDVK